jgi:hypothetical protein
MMKTTALFRKWLIISCVLILFAVVMPVRHPTTLAASLKKPNNAPPHSHFYLQASSDDARQTELFGGTLSLEAQNLFVGDFGTIPSYVGLRFNSVTVSQGATISQAFIKFRSSGNWSGVTTLNIHGHYVDHSPAFSPGNGPADRQGEFTSAQVSWNPEDWNENFTYYSSDIAPIIQEIIDRPGWYEGNAISLIISDGDGLNNVIRKFVAWDQDSAEAAELTIIFPESTGTDQVAVCEDNPTLINWLGRFFPTFFSDPPPPPCGMAFEDPADEPDEGPIGGLEPVLCLTSPECVIVSGIAGLIMLIVGGGLGWFISGLMRFSKGGKLFFAIVGAVAGSIIGSVVVGRIVSVGMSESIAPAPPGVTSDMLFCDAYFKTNLEKVTNDTNETVDVLISSTVPNNVTLPPDSRFHLTVWDHSGNLHEFVTTDSDISLADLGLSPDQIGRQLLWQVEIESLAESHSDQFLPICLTGSVQVYNIIEQPACESFLKTYAESITDQSGEVTDILIYIAVPADVTLPPNSRFRVTVKDNFGNPRDIVTDDTSVSLDAAGLFPDLIDSPLIWQVSVEYLAGIGGDLFLPYCDGGTLYEFDFVPPGESQLEETPVATAIPTPSPTTSPPTPIPPIPPTATEPPPPPPPKDTSGPKVSGANASPNPALTTSPVTISATISDGSGVASATVYYKTGKGGYQSAGNMKSGGGNQYFLNIGALTPAGTYTFRILATDSLGNANCSSGGLDACPGGSFVVNIP